MHDMLYARIWPKRPDDKIPSVSKQINKDRHACTREEDLGLRLALSDTCFASISWVTLSASDYAWPTTTSTLRTRTTASSHQASA